MVTRNSGPAFYVTRAPMRMSSRHTKSCSSLCGVVGGAQPRPVWEEHLVRLAKPDTAAGVDGGLVCVKL